LGAHTLTPLRPGDHNVLEVEAFSFPGGVAVIIHGYSHQKAGGVFGHKEAVNRVGAESIEGHSLHCVGHVGETVLIICQLFDQFEYARQVAHFSRPYGHGIKMK
jgi:hypothetical protein